MQIYCARHGEAAAGELDSQRLLTDVGISEVERIALRMFGGGASINKIIHSPKLRAQQTAEIFARVLNVTELYPDEALVDESTDPTSFIDSLTAYGDNILIVGHLPFIHDFLSKMLATTITPITTTHRHRERLRPRPRHSAAA